MVHVSISPHGQICMVEMNGNFDSNRYCDLLKESVFPLIPYYMQDSPWVWQQDNAPIHVSKHSLNFFEKESVEIFDWPARSPDLNIVENIFSYMSNQLYRGGKVYKRKNDLWAAMVKVFEEISLDYIKKLYGSMGKKIGLVLLKKGGKIDY